MRRRGLVRALLQHAHRLSEARGHLAQVITGIPSFYKQFGYELALPWRGGRSGYALPERSPDTQTSEQWTCRPPQGTDIPWLVDLYGRAMQRYLLTTQLDAMQMIQHVREHSSENVDNRSSWTSENKLFWIFHA